MGSVKTDEYNLGHKTEGIPTPLHCSGLPT